MEDYGFRIYHTLSDLEIAILTKNSFDVVVKSQGLCYYSNNGFDSRLKEKEFLLKVFFEIRMRKLVQIIIGLFYNASSNSCLYLSKMLDLDKNPI